MNLPVHRTVQPELLDSLPAEDSRAMRSRRDLARINLIMRQSAMMAARLRALPPPETLVDLGGGDARFLLGVARRLEWLEVHAVICDRQNIVGGETRHGFKALGWTCEMRKGEIFDTLESLPRAPSGAPRARGGKGPVYVTANLFLHHFADEELKRLLALAAPRAAAFIAVEPRRSTFALLGARLVGLIGANAVTRHDAVASVRAGFRGRELTALWPQPGWTCQERGHIPFSHCFTATRNAL